MIDRRRRTDPLVVMSAVMSLIVAIIVGAFGYPTLLDVHQLANQNASNADLIERESRERRDQMCVLFEREHQREVVRLARTYEYLSELPADEYGKPLTVAIVGGLGEQEDEARQDAAPEFCNARGIGLPEPGVKPPPKRNFGALLERP